MVKWCVVKNSQEYRVRRDLNDCLCLALSILVTLSSALHALSSVCCRQGGVSVLLVEE